MAIREMLWDCQSCHTRGILGRHKQCTGCGAPRPQGTKFYKQENAQAITDSSLLQQAAAGPDWYCLHCSAANPGNKEKCSQCGAEKGTSPSHKVTDYPPGQMPTVGNLPLDDPQPQPRPRRRASASSPTTSLDSSVYSERPVPLWAFGLLGLAIAGLILWLLWPSKMTVRVSDMSWERSVTLEASSLVVGEGWSLPEGARLLNQQTRQNGTTPVLDHYVQKVRQSCSDVPDGFTTDTVQDCGNVQTGTNSVDCGDRDLGNGFSEDIYCDVPKYEYRCEPKAVQVPKYRNVCVPENYNDPVYRYEPVFQEYYTYETTVWNFSREPTLSAHDSRPRWPEFILEPNERESRRFQKYVVVFVSDEGKNYTKEMSLGEWERFDLDDEVEVKVNSLGMITEFVSE